MRVLIVWLAIIVAIPSLVFAADIKDNDTPKNAKLGEKVRFSIKVSGDVSKAVLAFKVDGPDIKKDMRPIIGKNKWELDWIFNTPGEKKYEFTIYNKKGKKADDKDGKIQIAGGNPPSKPPTPNPPITKPVDPPKQQYGSVKGILHENTANGTLLSGVSIRCAGKNGTNKGDGTFTLDGIPVGNHEISFSKSGYETYKMVVPITEGQTYSVGDRWLNGNKTGYLPTPTLDKEKPRLHNFAPNKPTIKVGETVDISYTVSDNGGSGLRQVELWKGKDKGNLGRYKIMPLKGNGPVSGKFTDSPSPEGTTYYYGIHVLDNNDNLTYDNGARSVVVLFAKKQPPTPVYIVRPLPNDYKLGAYGYATGTDYGYHLGIDIMSPNSYPEVRSMCKGTVRYDSNIKNRSNDYDRYWNSLLIIEHDCNNDGVNDVFGYYGHIDSSKKIGDGVIAGENIGKVRLAYEKINGQINKKPSLNHLHLSLNKGYHEIDWGYVKSIDAIRSNGWINPDTYLINRFK